MERRRFGPTDYEVSIIGLGGMPLSIEGRPSTEDAVRVIHAALDAGVTLIDTADVYCLDDDDIGHNEQLVSRALWSWSGDPDTVLVCTKGGLRRPGGEWRRDASPAQLRAACERSLSALGVDRIAVYQLHAPDAVVPFADSVNELARLRDEGKIEHVGLSNVSVAQLDEAREIVPIVSVQNRCNVFDRGAFDEGIVAACEALGIAFLPYSPVGGGRGQARTASSRSLREIGARHGASPYQVALAWLLAKSPAMFPIPGASKVESILSSVGAPELTLSAEDVARIDADPA